MSGKLGRGTSHLILPLILANCLEVIVQTVMAKSSYIHRVEEVLHLTQLLVSEDRDGYLELHEQIPLAAPLVNWHALTLNYPHLPRLNLLVAIYMQNTAIQVGESLLESEECLNKWVCTSLRVSEMTVWRSLFTLLK